MNLLERIKSILAPFADHEAWEALILTMLQDIQTQKDLKHLNVIEERIMESYKIKRYLYDIEKLNVPLPNATVGKAYKYTFDWSYLGFKHLLIRDVKLPEDWGLAYDHDSSVISGTPTLYGDLSIEILFTLPEDKAPETIHIKKTTIVVNPNPKSLWKTIDSDRNDPYWKPDEAILSHSDIYGMNLIIASKRGRSHAHEGKFRDDDFAYASNLHSQWHVIALADGAGSAKFSRQGSKLACQTVVQYIEHEASEKLSYLNNLISLFLQDDSDLNKTELNNFLYTILSESINLSYNKLREESSKEGNSIHDYSTTLLFVLLKKFDQKYIVISFGVGDGCIGALANSGEEFVLLSEPDSGEYAGQTRFLTSGDLFKDSHFIVKRTKFKILSNLDVLFIMTDGISDPKFQADASLSRIENWIALWKDLTGDNEDNIGVDLSNGTLPQETASQLLRWLDFWSPGNHDDRTMAILYKND